MFRKDLFFIVCVSVMLAAIESPFPSIAGLILLIFYLKFTGRLYLLENLLASLFLALLWVYFAKANYHYSSGFAYVGGVCVFPVIAWGMALFGISMLLSNFDMFTESGPLNKIILHSLVFTAGLIIIEYTAYHIFGFKNQATLKYPPIPVINCIHAPRWMQAMYFLMAPIYGSMLGVIQFIRDFSFSAVEADQVD